MRLTAELRTCYCANRDELQTPPVNKVMSIRKTKDGRTIRTGKDYTQFRRSIWELQDGRCARTGSMTSLTAPLECAYSFHVHHIGGRGLGGSKRDDIPSKVEGLSGTEHRKEHNQG